MKYFGFCFKIKPEMKDEYKKAHDDIWPEYAKAVRAAGILNQSIFFREDGTLFLYFESDNPEESLKKRANIPLDIKWQKKMEKFVMKDKKNLYTLSKHKSVISETRPEAIKLELLFHQD